MRTKGQKLIVIALAGLALHCASNEPEQGTLNLPEICGTIGIHCAEDGESIRGGGAVISTSFSRCTSGRYTSLRNRDLGLKEMAIMTMTIMLTEEEKMKAGIGEPATEFPPMDLLLDAGVNAHDIALIANINETKLFWRVFEYPWEDLQRTGYPDALQIEVLATEEAEKGIMVTDALLGGFPTHGSGIGEDLKDNCGWDEDPEPRGMQQRGEARAAYAKFLRSSVESLYDFLLAIIMSRSENEALEGKSRGDAGSRLTQPIERTETANSAVPAAHRQSVTATSVAF